MAECDFANGIIDNEKTVYLIHACIMISYLYMYIYAWYSHNVLFTN